MKTILKIVGVFFGVFVLVYLVFFVKAMNDPDIDKMTHGRMAIELCWKEQARKSLTPAEQRFIAGTCEKMEEDYIKKFGMEP